MASGHTASCLSPQAQNRPGTDSRLPRGAWVLGGPWYLPAEVRPPRGSDRVRPESGSPALGWGPHAVRAVHAPPRSPREVPPPIFRREWWGTERITDLHMVTLGFDTPPVESQRGLSPLLPAARVRGPGTRHWTVVFGAHTSHPAQPRERFRWPEQVARGYICARLQVYSLQAETGNSDVSLLLKCS